MPGDYSAEIVLTSNSDTFVFNASSEDDAFVITLDTDETESQEVINSGKYTITITRRNNTGESVSANIQILIPNGELCRI